MEIDYPCPKCAKETELVGSGERGEYQIWRCLDIDCGWDEKEERKNRVPHKPSKIWLILPYPPPELNPNKRLHWATKIKIKTAERDMGAALGIGYKGQITGDVPLKLVFYPETKRSFDLDNALASCKWALDGLAAGLGINDKQFRPITIDRGAPDKDEPRVEVTIG